MILGEHWNLSDVDLNLFLLFTNFVTFGKFLNISKSVLLIYKVEIATTESFES